MEISVSQEQGRVLVGIIRASGQLDGQTYTKLIDAAHELYKNNVRDLLLDFSNLSYISSAGLVSLHTIALMVRGEAVPDPSQSWSSLKAMDKTRDGGKQKHLKLLNPRIEILNILELVGFSDFFEVFTDKDQAIQSF